MAESTDELRPRVEALLASSLDRGALLRELEALAREPGFEGCADLWAPALYAREPGFFETFLLRHLDADGEATIRALLPRVEADGYEALFTGLYRKITDEDTWNADLLGLAQSAIPDDVVLQAVQRRNLGRAGYSLSEATALALYRRGPMTFSDFVGEHVNDEGESDDEFQQLRDEARRRGDDELYWALFRKLADADEWVAALRELLQQGVPASSIARELRKRQPDATWNLDANILAEFVERYGNAVLPYLETNLAAIAHRDVSRLLAAVEQLGDDALYWRLFFQAGNSRQWNQSLRELLKQPLADDALALALQHRTPPAERWSRWQIENDLALALYRRSPDLSRGFLERLVVRPDIALFEAAERVGDDEFLDFLTSRLVRMLASLVSSAYLTPSQERWQKPDAKARERLEQTGQIVTARLDRLYAQSPAIYVEHAAAIMGRFEAEEGWSFPQNVAHNPVFSYLFHRYHDAWRSSPAAIRELLESPNLFVQRMGLVILGEDVQDTVAAETAHRVVENLPLLRALLLGSAGRNMKRLALACLDRAGRESLTAADQILPVFEDALHFEGRRAIDERLMVSYVRLRRLRATQEAAAQSA